MQASCRLAASRPITQQATQLLPTIIPNAPHLTRIPPTPNPSDHIQVHFPPKQSWLPTRTAPVHASFLTISTFSARMPSAYGSLSTRDQQDRGRKLKFPEERGEREKEKKRPPLFLRVQVQYLYYWDLLNPSIIALKGGNQKGGSEDAEKYIRHA